MDKMIQTNIFDGPSVPLVHMEERNGKNYLLKIFLARLQFHWTTWRREIGQNKLDQNIFVPHPVSLDHVKGKKRDKLSQVFGFQWTRWSRKRT